MNDVAPNDGDLVVVHAGLADFEDAVVAPGAGADAEVVPDHSAFAKTSAEQRPNAPVVTARALAVPTLRLPILGLLADVGVPDGLIGSLVIRPYGWIPVSGGGGTNSISKGWRAGVTLLPLGAGPSASLEYGRYQDGDANGLAKRFVCGGATEVRRWSGLATYT